VHSKPKLTLKGTNIKITPNDLLDIKEQIKKNKALVQRIKNDEEPEACKVIGSKEEAIELMEAIGRRLLDDQAVIMLGMILLPAAVCTVVIN